MIPEIPTLSNQFKKGHGFGCDVLTIPLENGYSLDIEIATTDPRALLFDARHQIVYTQPWRTDAIRNCMDAMVRNECATPKSTKT